MGGTPHLLNYANGFEKQTASFALVKPRLLAGDTDVLARKSTGQYIHRRNLIAVNLRDIPQMLHLRKAAGGHSDGVGLHLAGEHGRDAVLRSGQFKGAAAGKQRAQRHHAGTSRSSNTTGFCLGFLLQKLHQFAHFRVYAFAQTQGEDVPPLAFAFMTMCVAVELGRIFRASSGFSPFSSRK